LTQADLAAKAGVGLSTIVAIEKGAPTVQLGFWLNALWALDLLQPFAQLTQLGLGAPGTALLEAQLPQRVRSSRKRHRAISNDSQRKA
jgi:transcriptional regulator with XRE-family HTH domain